MTLYRRTITHPGYRKAILKMTLLDEVMAVGHTNPPTDTPASIRWYIRCKDCLAVSSVDVPAPTLPEGWAARRRQIDGTRPKGLCGFCKGEVEVMGFVGAEGTAQRPILFTGCYTECKCNEKCANATGPNCECQCGGANHGAGIAAFVTVDDYTGIPTYTAPSKHSDKYKRQGAEYRRARIEAMARIKALPAYATYEAKRNGEYVTRFSHYLEVCNLIDQIRAADNRRTHKGRITALNRIATA